MLGISAWNAVFFLLMAFVYMLPAIMAFRRKHRNRVAILLVSVFAGWTVIIWLVALVWAVYVTKGGGEI